MKNITVSSMLKKARSKKIPLSNKDCRNYYRRSTDKESTCNCPPGRCWYKEQVARQLEGLPVISPENWK